MSVLPTFVVANKHENRILFRMKQSIFIFMDLGLILSLDNDNKQIATIYTSNTALSLLSTNKVR